jgi:phage baseplate assembly protein W
MPTYYGFSTISSSSQKKYVLTDKKLIKQDLLNILNTRRGSRVMNPRLGCVAWEMLFENLSQAQIESLSANITAIVNGDPRLNLQSLDVSTVGNNLTLTLKLMYVHTNEVETMQVQFDAQAQTATSF